jgi:hypothetical protein
MFSISDWPNTVDYAEANLTVKFIGKLLSPIQIIVMRNVKGNRTFYVTEDFLHIWLAVKIKKQGNKPKNLSTVESRCNV